MSALDEIYSHLVAWVKEVGSIEIGYNYSDHDPSFLRVIQYTDLVWSSDSSFASLEDAFAEMETTIAKWCEEQGITLRGM